MSKRFDHAVVIGRFQPFHNGHLALIEHALSVAAKVIVVLGSSGAARNCRNPFTAQERRRMILWSLEERGTLAATSRRIEFVEVRDYFYNDTMWLNDLQQKVYRITQHKGKTALVGFAKDKSSYYLSMFPSWEFEQHDPFKDGDHVLDATFVRELWFEDDDRWQVLVPEGTQDVLKDVEFQSRRHPLAEGNEVLNLREQYKYLQEYPKVWGKGPFVTVDAVVTMKGHVLVVERGQIPGKGLLAVPGGFLDPNEKLIDSAVRELLEEAEGMSIFTADEIKRCLVAKEVFDHPQRSERGRTITHAFHFSLDRLNHPGLPYVKGGDDASNAMWLPFFEAFSQPHLFYEDHGSILTWALTQQSL